jgi:metal-dependent amidase/aminoacylase/carboxypeptidase family protein
MQPLDFLSGLLMAVLKNLVAAQKATIIDWRRALHQTPETGFTETKDIGVR